MYMWCAWRLFGNASMALGNLIFFNQRVICTISMALPCRCLVLPSDRRFHNNGLYSFANLYKSYHYFITLAPLLAIFSEKLAAVILWCYIDISRKKMCNFVHSLFPNLTISQHFLCCVVIYNESKDDQWLRSKKWFRAKPVLAKTL